MASLSVNEVISMIIKSIVFCLVILSFPFGGMAADSFDPILFGKHVRLIHVAQEADYSAQLERLFAKAGKEGASLEAVLSISRKATVSYKDILEAAVKSYPPETVITGLIKSSRDAEEIVKIAVFSGIDTKTIISGAIAAGIKPVDAEVMVAIAMKLKREKGVAGAKEEGENSGLALTPGEELDNGGAPAAGNTGAAGDSGAGDAGPAGGGASPAGGAAGPVGGSGGGVASPS